MCSLMLSSTVVILTLIHKVFLWYVILEFYSRIPGKNIESGISIVASKPVNDPPPEDSVEGEYEYIDMDKLEEKCWKAYECPASIKYFIVCGSDGLIYQNIGVLACAQRCNIGLKITKFGPCDGAKKVPRMLHRKLSQNKARISKSSGGKGKTKSKKKGSSRNQEDKSIEVKQESLPSARMRNRATSKPRRATTLVNYWGIEMNPETQVNITDNKTRIALQDLLHHRMSERLGDYKLPQEWRDWCDKNPERCYPGFDPRYNPAVYLIPYRQDEREEAWNREHGKYQYHRRKRLYGGFTTTTEAPREDVEF